MKICSMLLHDSGRSFRQRLEFCGEQGGIACLLNCGEAVLLLDQICRDLCYGTPTRRVLHFESLQKSYRTLSFWCVGPAAAGSVRHPSPHSSHSQISTSNYAVHWGQRGVPRLINMVVPEPCSCQAPVPWRWADHSSWLIGNFCW